MLRYKVAELAGIALLVAAIDAGHTSPATRRLVGFDLTPKQSEALAGLLGGPAPRRWLVDVDHTIVTYAEDWGAGEPTPLGRRGLVLPAGAALPPGDRLLVRLPSGVEGVFGTGRHVATQLAAGLLEEHLRPGEDVVDLGTGSGVLAVFAVRLGAKHVSAVDTSPAAIEAATRTVALNGCAEEVELVLGELAPGDPPVDLIVANILAGVLLDLVPTLVGRLRPGGRLITSGIVDARAAQIVEAYTAAGLDHIESVARGGWTGCVFTKARSGPSR